MHRGQRGGRRTEGRPAGRRVALGLLSAGLVSAPALGTASPEAAFRTPRTHSGPRPASDAARRTPPADTATRRVAVTFDDVPRQGGAMGCDDPAAVLEMNSRLVSLLESRAVPATAFVTGVNACGPDAAEHLRRALEVWLDAGMELGNHTWSHPDIDDVPVDAYLADADRGAAAVVPALRARGERLRWFRPPYLHTGRTPEKERALERALAERGWRMAPVTLDNDEWIFAAAYRRARRAGDAEGAARVVEAYVDHMAATFRHFERVSDAVLGRQVPQVLLVHASPLNAVAFGRVLDVLSGRGYAFVSLEEALQDPAYDIDDDYVGEEGLSWLLRWARTLRVAVEETPRAPGWIARSFRGASGGGARR